MKIGFIGLGIMGKPMAKNVVKAGYDVLISSSNTHTNKEMAEKGVKVLKSMEELIKKSDIIILMLPNSPEVEEVILGEYGIVKHGNRGTKVIDMSSIAPNVSKTMYKNLKEVGVDYLDAPVSGGEPKAIEGTISVMVGGDEDVYQNCLPIIESMADSITRVGESGAGNSTKLVNQIIVALNIASISEGFILAEKMGVDTELVYNAIRGGLAGSTVLDAKVPNILEGDFNPGFKINLHLKDMNNVKDTLKDVNLNLPLTNSITEVLESLIEHGDGEDDHGAIIKHYERDANVEVRNKK